MRQSSSSSLLGRSCARAGIALVLSAAALALPARSAERGPTPVQTHDGATAATSTAAAAIEARVIVKYRADSALMRALSATSAGTSSTSSSSNAPTATTTASSILPLRAAALATRLGLALSDGSPLGPTSQVVRATGIASEELASRLAAQADIEYAVVDHRVRIAAVPNDALFGVQASVTPAAGQWYLRTPGSDGQIASIDAPAAWSITTGSASVVVAVIDTGITSHPDLAGKVLQGYDFISDATTAGDGDGRDADPTDPGDGVMSGQETSISSCTSSDIATSSWHGTQTAGLIGAATDNATGMAGVGWNVMLLPLRALGKCGGSESDVIAAIRWAAGGTVPGVPANAHPAKVINLSLGGTSGVACDAAYQDAVSYATAQEVVVVAAAGNDGLALGAPANCTGVVSVAGVRHIGTKVGYSDLGANVTIAAPAGNCVNGTGTCLFPLLTTSNDGAYTVGNPVYTDGDVRPTLGTSFSTPLVAGVVALMLSANPSLTPVQVKAALASSARAFPQTGSPPIQRTAGGPLVPVAACQAPTTTAQDYECYCTTSTCGAGLLDAGAAVLAVALAPIVTVSASTASVTAGTSVTFTGSVSLAGATTSVQSYSWTISSSGTAVASFSSATNAASATVATSAAGSFVVTLAVTDSDGRTGTSTSTVTVAAAPLGSNSGSTGTPTNSSSSDSGGGGSLSPGWLLGLLGAVLALCVVDRRRSGRRSR